MWQEMFIQLEAKSKIPRALKADVPRNEHNKGVKDWGKFGCNITKNSRGALLLYMNNLNTLWYYAISKKMTTLGNISVFQLYPPKTSLRINMAENMRQCIWFLMWSNSTYDKNLGYWLGSCCGFQGVHHIFIYHQRRVYKIDVVDICEEWVRNHAYRYFKCILYGPIFWKDLVLLWRGVWS